MMRTEGSGERARRLETGRLPTADGVHQPEDSTASTNGYVEDWCADGRVPSAPFAPTGVHFRRNAHEARIDRLDQRQSNGESARRGGVSVPGPNRRVVEDGK